MAFKFGGIMAEGAVANIAPLLLDSEQAAILCGVGRSLWWSLHSAGRVPLPVKLGRRTLWRREELESWIRAGCPARDKWEALRVSQDNSNFRRTGHAI